MREAESLCAENIGLKDIARNRRGELISRSELIMYYRPCFTFYAIILEHFVVTTRPRPF